MDQWLSGPSARPMRATAISGRPHAAMVAGASRSCRATASGRVPPWTIGLLSTRALIPKKVTSIGGGWAATRSTRSCFPALSAIRSLATASWSLRVSTGQTPRRAGTSCSMTSPPARATRSPIHPSMRSCLMLRSDRTGWLASFTRSSWQLGQTSMRAPSACPRPTPRPPASPSARRLSRPTRSTRWCWPTTVARTKVAARGWRPAPGRSPAAVRLTPRR